MATLAFFDTVTMAARTILEVPPAQGNAGAGEAGLGEGPGGYAWSVAGYDREIQALVLDAGVGGICHKPVGRLYRAATSSPLVWSSMATNDRARDHT